MSDLSKSDGKMSRRSALQVGAATGYCGAVVAATLQARCLPGQKMSVSQWTNLVGQEFKVLAKSFETTPDEFRPVKLRLEEAVELTTKTQANLALPSTIPMTQISLLFSGDMRLKLVSATYQVDHHSIGKLDLFINEIQPNRANVRQFESIVQ